MLRGEKLSYQVEMPIVMNNGGLGDHICAMPAIFALLENYPQLTPTYYIHSYFKPLFRVFMKYRGHRYKKKNLQFIERGTSYEFKQALYFSERQHTSMRRSLINFAFQCYLDREPLNDLEAAYPTFDYRYVPLEAFKLPDRFVVVCSGYTAPARAWSGVEMNKVIEWLSETGYTPVFLGSSQVAPGISGNFDGEVAFEKGLDLREKTSLIQAAAILGAAKAVVGVDNGLLHLAACTSTPIVAGFPTVDPAARQFIRPNGKRMENVKVIVPDESLTCRWCQSRINFVAKHDFKECYYGDYKCRDHMSGEKFIEALKELLEVKK